MRIALFIAHFDAGGVAVVVTDLANALAARGHRVELLALDGSGPLKSRADDAVRLVDLKCGAARFALPRLMSYLSAAKPDVLLGASTHINTLVILAGLLRGFRGPRIIATEHSALGHRATTWRARLLFALVRMTYRLPHRVVCCSEGIRQELIEEHGLPPERIVTIHNAVVGPRALAALEAESQDPWLTASADPLIVTAGRLHHQKDHRTLLLAFARLAAKRPARLLILGEGDERPGLEALIRDLGLAERVRLAGQVDDPLARMKAADLFVLSSRYEGLPTVLIEALLCGLPVVSTDCRHGPREILEGGRYGTLVPVGDPEALAAAMVRALDAKRDPEAQRQRAMAFGADPAAARYEALFADRPAPQALPAEVS